MKGLNVKWDPESKKKLKKKKSPGFKIESNVKTRTKRISTWIKQSVDTNTENTEIWELSDNDFKAAILKMLQCNYKHAWNEWKKQKALGGKK